MNALKKVLSWLLALTMVLSMATTVAFAGEIMAVFTLESPEAAVKVGDTFTIPVKITENKSIASLTMNTKFDQTAFRLDKIDFTNKEVFSGCLSGGQTDSSNEKYGKWLITQATSSADTGLLVELTFTVLETATAGNYTIDLESEELYDAEYNDLDCTIVPATVTVAEDEPVGSPKIVVGYTENGETKYNEIDDNRLVLQAGGQTVGADYNWPTTELLYVLDGNGNVIEDIDWDMDDHSQIFWSSESSYPLTASYAQVRGNTDGAKATITATLPDETTVSIEVETKTYANTVSAYDVASENTYYYSSYYKALIVDTDATFTLSPTKVCSGKSTELTDTQLANNTLTYASGDESILTVDAQTGEYTAVGKGETTIYMCVAGQEHGKNTVAPLKAINVYCGDAYAQDLRFSKDGTLIEKDYSVTNAFGTTYYAQTSVAVGKTQEIALTSVPAAAIENITVSGVSSADTAKVTVVNDNGTLKLTGVAETESPIKVSVNWKRTNVSDVSGTFVATLYVNVTEKVTAESVSVEPTALPEMKSGDTSDLTATIFPEDTADKTVTWTSSNEEVATVDENGKVTAVKTGIAMITATTANGISGSCEVTVNGGKDYSGSKIVVQYTDDDGLTKYNEIDDNKLFLQGDPAPSNTMAAYWPQEEVLCVLDADGNIVEDVDWNLDGVANIVFRNYLTSLTASSTTVRAGSVYVNGEKAKSTLTATLPDESVLTLPIEAKRYATYVGGFTLSSENPYYNFNDKIIADIGAEINVDYTWLSYTPTTNENKKLTDEELAEIEFSYASADESILTVDAQTGECEVVGNGETQIYLCAAGQEHGKKNVHTLKTLYVYCGDAYAQDLCFSKDGTVLEKDYSVTNAFGTTTYYYAQTSVAVGETQEINLVTFPTAAIENITVQNVTNYGEDYYTAEIDDNGVLKITGVAATEKPMIISIKWKRNNTSLLSDSLYAKLCVNVTAADVAVTGVTLDQESLNLVLGDTETAMLTATVTTEDATDKTVTWTSSNEEVATVDENGFVTAVGAGEATITATAGNNVSASCAVTVEEAGPIYYATSVKTVITETSNNKEPYSTSSNGNANEYVYIVDSDDVGFTMQGKATVYSKDNTDTGLATSQSVTWGSNSDSSIASVDDDGQITWNGGYGKYIAYADAPTANGGSYAGNIVIYFTPAIAKTAEIEVSDENGKVTDTADSTSYKGTEVTAYIVEDGSDIILDAVLDAPEMAEYTTWTVKADSKYNFTPLSDVNRSTGKSLTITPETYNTKISADGDFKLLQVTASVPAYAGGAKSTYVTIETIYILLVEESAEPTPEPTVEPTPEPTTEPTPEPSEEPVVTIDEDHADMNVSAETVTEGETVQLKLSIENDADASSKYNSYEFHVSYDPELLTYESVSCSDGENCSVTETTKGSLVINGYGADKTVSEDAFVTLIFKTGEVSETTDTDVKLNAAYRDTSAGAVDTDIDEIEVETSVKTITIENVKASYKVSFSETVKVNGEDVTEATVTEGESVTFEVIEKTGHTFTVDGADKNADGSYTVTPTDDTTVTITHTAKTYTVTVEGSGKDDVTASATATFGKAYSFTLNKDDGFNYSVSVKVGGNTVSATESDGTYTISADDVTGDIVITVSKEAKAPVKTEYSVTLYENGVANAATEKATEGEAYSKSATEGYKIYKVVMNEQEISSFTAESVSIESVTGNIEINMGKIYDVTLPEDNTATGESSANYGSDYTFTAEDGYQTGATVDGEDVDLIDNGDGSYTIKGSDITGEIIISTEKIVYVEAVNVYDYVKSEDATLIQLVVATAKEGALSDGEILQYNGANMFRSEKYEGYAYLVVIAADEDKLTSETAAANIGKANATATSISYAGDVNMTGTTDVNDAQLIYDIYKALYNDFSIVSMEKMLRADMNADHEVNVSDARAVAAIVNQ